MSIALASSFLTIALSALNVGVSGLSRWARLLLFAALDQVAPENRSDEALMEAYLGGDDRAFRHLFDRFAPRIHGAARRRGFSAADASDVVQQTFVHVHQSRRDFRAGAEVRPWIYTIAFNVIRDMGRRFSSQSRLKDRIAAEPRPETASVKESPTGRVSPLRSALGRLSPAQREVLELHYFQEMSFRDIARLIGSGEGAVRVRAHRGYQKLRHILAGTKAKGGIA